MIGRCLRRPTLRILALAQLLAAIGLAQTPVEETGSEMEILVEVRSPGGQWRSDLGPADLAVEEDGIVATVLTVEPLAPRRASRDAVRRAQAAASSRPWQILLYFDAPLLTPASRRLLIEALLPRVSDLTALGTVEIVEAAPLPRTRLAPTRDPKLVGAMLESVLHAPGGEPELAAGRRHYLDRGLMARAGGASSRGDGSELTALRREVLAAARLEAGLVGQQLETLRWWLATYPATLPKALIYVSDGYDPSPIPFYLAGFAEGGLRHQLESDLADLDLAAATEETGIEAGALGWTVLPLWRRSLRTPLPAGEGRQPIFARAGSLLVTPTEPLERLATLTAGDVSSPLGLERTLSELNRRTLIIYRALRPPDRALHRVAVHAPKLRLRLRSAGWRTAPGDGEAGTERRPTPASAASEDGNDLRCEYRGSGEGAPTLLVCRLRLGREQQAAAAGLSPSSLRLTLFGSGPHGERQRIDRVLPVAAENDSLGAGLELELPLPDRLEGRPLMIVVSEEEHRLWAIARLEPVPKLAHLSRPAAYGIREPAPERGIHLMPFDQPLVAGPVLVEALATDPRIARVEFWLDRVRVSIAEMRPFEAWLKLGTLPKPHTIEAVGFASGGREIGRDEMLINRGLGRRRVRIKTPRQIAGAGLYDVELEVSAPPSVSPLRVELYWNEKRLQTLERPPYRARVELPSPVDGDFLRALAEFDDGELSEDAVLKSRRGFTFASDVEMIELYTVARDPLGRPLADLEAQEFAIFEEGRPQVLSSFEYADNVPLRLALTLDISESMLPRMPIVKRAAREFFEALLGPRDQAILAAFNHRPFLLHGPTADAESLVRDIDQLPSTGGTALYDAILFSLQQLNDLSGRKALVLLTDGKNKHSRFSLDAALQFARRSSLPIYLIAIDDQRTPLDLQESLALGRLARLTGGEMFSIRSEERLSDIYRELALELRHQYVLAYQSDYEGKSRSWRRIRVEVKRPGVRAQTISGYFPQR